MKREQFSVEQIGLVLERAKAAVPVAKLISTVGISGQRFCRSKKRGAGRGVDRRESSFLQLIRLLLQFRPGQAYGPEVGDLSSDAAHRFELLRVAAHAFVLGVGKLLL